MDRLNVQTGLLMFLIALTAIAGLSGRAEATLADAIEAQGAPDIPTYYFDIFTNNGIYSSSDQVVLYVQVLDPGDGKVEFRVHNDSEVYCSIARVYFDDGTLLGIAGINNEPGTDFTQPAVPAELPAYNDLNPPFKTTQDFSVSPDKEPSHNGINPGEQLGIIFTLKDGFVYEDVLSQLDDMTLRIGAHVIAFADGSGESAVTPEPATLAVLGIGGLVFCRKRRCSR